MASVSGGLAGRALATGGARGDRGRALWAIGGIVGLLVCGRSTGSPGSRSRAFDHPFAWYHWAALLAIIPFMALVRGSARIPVAVLAAGGGAGDDGSQAADASAGRARSAVRGRVLRRHEARAAWRLARYRRHLGADRVIVHRLDQPWRGILDAGVVVGLSWGTIATLALSVRAWRS